VDELTAFDVYFAQLASWRYHPGYLRDPDKRPSLEDCAKDALVMLNLRNQVWQSLQAQQ